MRIFEMPRRSGKTTKLLEWMDGEPNSMLVTFSEKEVDRLRKIVIQKEMDIDPKQIVSITNIHNLYGQGYKVRIDELELVLGAIIPERIEAATLTTHHET